MVKSTVALGLWRAQQTAAWHWIVSHGRKFKPASLLKTRLCSYPFVSQLVVTFWANGWYSKSASIHWRQYCYFSLAMESLCTLKSILQTGLQLWRERRQRPDCDLVSIRLRTRGIPVQGDKSRTEIWSTAFQKNPSVSTNSKDKTLFPKARAHSKKSVRSVGYSFLTLPLTAALKKVSKLEDHTKHRGKLQCWQLI